jgi:hypothetical protein
MEANIPKNRMTDLVNDRVIPKPEEVTALDKSLKQNRRMVLNYCSSVCEAGKYAGYNFTEMDSHEAAIMLISNLSMLDKLIPELAGMLARGKVSPEMLAKLSQLRLAIMTLEVQLQNSPACCSAELAELQEFLKQKEKATARTAANENHLP